MNQRHLGVWSLVLNHTCKQRVSRAGFPFVRHFLPYCYHDVFGGLRTVQQWLTVPQLGGQDVCKNKKFPLFAGGLLVIMLVPLTHLLNCTTRILTAVLALLCHASNCCSYRKVLLLLSSQGTIRKLSNFQTITLHPFWWQVLTLRVFTWYVY